MKKKILISGAGVAGMICAIVLDKNKYEVTLIERSDSPRNIGYSVALWKGCYEHLFALSASYGVSLVSEKDYFMFHNFIIRRGDSIKILKTIYAEKIGLVFERQHLMEKLQEMLVKNFDVKKIHFSKTIKHIHRNESSSLVTFNDGSSKEYDVVIIAEGINSTSRKIVFPDEVIKPYPYSLKYAWFKSETSLGYNFTLFLAHGSAGIIHPPYFKNLLGYYIRNDAPKEFEADFETLVRQNIKRKDGENSEIDLNSSHVFDLKEVFLKKYNKNNVVLVGDAAHGRPPSSGFGTSLAIEDAFVLCRKLNSISLGSFSEGGLRKTLDNYSHIRRKRVNSVYRFQSNIQIFLTKNRFKNWFIDHFGIYMMYVYVEPTLRRLANYSI